MSFDACDGTARRSCIVDEESGYAHTADAPYVVDFHGVAVAAGAVAQAYEDGTLGAFHREVRYVHVFHHAAVHDFQREGAGAALRLMAEELRTLVVAGFHADVLNRDVAEAAIGLGAQFHGIAMAAHHAVCDSDVLAEPWRGALQRNAVVVGVADHVAHRHLMAAVQVERIIIVVVAVDDRDAVNLHAVAGQPVLHPAS